MPVGAVCIDHYSSSLDAELLGLELALGALLEISRGYADVVPHSAQTTLREYEYQEASSFAEHSLNIFSTIMGWEIRDVTIVLVLLDLLIIMTMQC